MSQLGGLRGQVARLREAGDLPAILDWLRHLAENRTRAGKWPAGAIDRVRELLEDHGRVWELFRFADWPTLTGEADRLRAGLWPLAVRTLLDACVRAHKRDLESAREGNRGT
jgi:CRISPR-associated protein Csx10